MSGKLTETFQVLKILDDILVEAGSCKQNIVKVWIRVSALQLHNPVHCRPATCCCIQVCSYLKSIDDGADGYNEAWDAWVDPQNLPVSHCMLVCAACVFLLYT